MSLNQVGLRLADDLPQCPIHGDIVQVQDVPASLLPLRLRNSGDLPVEISIGQPDDADAPDLILLDLALRMRCDHRDLDARIDEHLGKVHRADFAPAVQMSA